MDKILLWLWLGAAGLVGSLMFMVAAWAAYIVFLAWGLE